MGLNPAKNSQHLTGHAADLVVNSMTQEQLFNFIRSCGVEFDQLIWEQYNNCVHISYVKSKNRNEVLIRDKKRNYKKIS